MRERGCMSVWKWKEHKKQRSGKGASGFGRVLLCLLVSAAYTSSASGMQFGGFDVEIGTGAFPEEGSWEQPGNSSWNGNTEENMYGNTEEPQIWPDGANGNTGGTEGSYEWNGNYVLPEQNLNSGDNRQNMNGEWKDNSDIPGMEPGWNGNCIWQGIQQNPSEPGNSYGMQMEGQTVQGQNGQEVPEGITPAPCITPTLTPTITPMPVPTPTHSPAPMPSPTQAPKTAPKSTATPTPVPEAPFVYYRKQMKATGRLKEESAEFRYHFSENTGEGAVTVLSKGSVQVLSLRVNGKETFWHWENGEIILDSKQISENPKIELLALSQGSRRVTFINFTAATVDASEKECYNKPRIV